MSDLFEKNRKAEEERKLHVQQLHEMNIKSLQNARRFGPVLLGPAPPGRQTDAVIKNIQEYLNVREIALAQVEQECIRNQNNLKKPLTKQLRTFKERQIERIGEEQFNKVLDKYPRCKDLIID